MLEDRQKNFNTIQQEALTHREMGAAALVAALMHQDKRQQELIEELASFKQGLGETTASLDKLKTAVDGFNSATGEKLAQTTSSLDKLKGAIDQMNASSTQLYGKLNWWTGVIAVATVCSAICFAWQIFHQH